MANNFEDKHRYQITEVLGVVSKQEDLHTNWCISVVKALMTNLKDNSEEDSIDIRNVHMGTLRPGKGIRLSPEEANTVANILIQHGYGDLEILESECEKRKSLYQEEQPHD